MEYKVHKVPFEDITAYPLLETATNKPVIADQDTEVQSVAFGLGRIKVLQLYPFVEVIILDSLDTATNKPNSSDHTIPVKFNSICKSIIFQLLPLLETIIFRVFKFESVEPTATNHFNRLAQHTEVQYTESSG